MLPDEAVLYIQYSVYIIQEVYMHSNSDWWLGKTAYQIYPKSFCDSNGDGIGDIPGIISRLDYLKWLGIDLIWLSPVYESPFIDQGYDISDYYRIASEFGTMADFDHLLAEAKKRGIGIVMDLVINHCSDKHEWFQKALAEPEGPYADYFYFVRGKDGKPPSNMRSYFGGSAWEAVPGTDKYYLHFFAKEQPDLNWENPKLRDEIYKMVNWWLDKGLAGFRIDAIMNIKKDISFPDYPADGADGTAQHPEQLSAMCAESAAGVVARAAGRTFHFVILRDLGSAGGAIRLPALDLAAAYLTSEHISPHEYLLWHIITPLQTIDKCQSEFSTL